MLKDHLTAYHPATLFKDDVSNFLNNYILCRGVSAGIGLTTPEILSKAYSNGTHILWDIFHHQFTHSIYMCRYRHDLFVHLKRKWLFKNNSFVNLPGIESTVVCLRT